MQTVLFYYTLSILLLSIMAAALCLAAFIVSRNRGMLFAFTAFLSYFFDIALVFHDDFFLAASSVPLETAYFVGSPIVSIVFGLGTFGSLWLLACDRLHERSRVVVAAPLVVFVAGSLIALVAVPAGRWHVLSFYAMRSVLLFTTIAYAAVGSARRWKEGVDGGRFHARDLALLAVLGGAVVAENVVFLVVVDVDALSGSPWHFLPQRNFAENALVMAWCVLAAISAVRTLALRFKQPPVGTEARAALRIADCMDAYCALHGLSAREGEVLRLLLDGKDNQNIASELSVALSTVKVHVHNILKKTGLQNRREVVQDFWRRA